MRRIIWRAIIFIDAVTRSPFMRSSSTSSTMDRQTELLSPLLSAHFVAYRFVAYVEVRETRLVARHIHIDELRVMNIQFVHDMNNQHHRHTGGNYGFHLGRGDKGGCDRLILDSPSWSRVARFKSSSTVSAV